MLNKEFWQNRYEEGKTGWDAAEVTTPIKEYFDKMENKTLKILIPGCGNAHEAVYLFNKGFRNLYLCDWAENALANFAKNNPGFPENQLICGDFFQLEHRDFDYVVEQTFFCAIDPDLRPDYAQKMSEILKEGGKLVGLFFGEALAIDREGPPFGGSKKEYMDYFTPHFSIVKMEDCKNSIKPREGSELFIEIIK